MALSDLRAAVDQAFVFSTAMLGESVSYKPRAGSARTIVVLTESYVPKTTGYRDTQRPQANRISDGIEYIRVTVCRDESAASGGIANEPSIGDTITRSASRDSDTRPFVYQGTELVKEAGHAVYLFGRDKRPYDTRRAAQT